jgi:alkanesulfonate monooxygenase SsuD/methylene tetrahydromethanopterin reductase-like flavin-dependent oxidoreductase (luciferase family)
VKLGALCWNQSTDWRSLREVAVRADRLGYDDLWIWDHLYSLRIR